MPLSVVGRRDEQALATRLVEELHVRSAVLVVVGEAGIGKTCLADLVEGLARDRSVRVLRGGCAPLGAGVPYAPLQGALAVARWSPGGREGPDGPAGRPGWFARFDAALADDPNGTLLVVEDAHWADLSTLAYLAHLSRNMPPLGLLVLVTYREEDAAERHSDWFAEQTRLPNVMTMRLDPLTPAQSIQLVQALVPGSTHHRAVAVHARSGGNPYLTSELALAPSAEELPATLRQVLLARLRSAGEGPSLVVAAAGLLARPAANTELIAAAGGDEYAVRDAYEKYLLIPAAGPDGAIPRHPVLAEMAYARLLPDERRGLHNRLALAMEADRLAGGTATGLAEIAEQHLLAGHSDDALVWSVRAADAAADQFAFAEAGRWYATAVSAGSSAEIAWPLVRSRVALADAGARALAIAGRHPAVLDLLDQVLEEEPSSLGTVDLLLRRSWSRFVTGDTSGALAGVRQALAVPGIENAPGVAAQVYAVLAHVHGTCSRWPEAVAAARMAERLAALAGNVRAAGLAATVLGVAALIEGQVELGLRRLEQSLATARTLGEPDDLALAGVCLADHYAMEGPVDRAIEVVESIRSDLRRLAPEGHWLDDMLGGNEAAALVAAGEWDRAIATAADVRGDLGIAELVVAVVDVARGDVDSARSRLARAGTLDRADQPQFHLSVANVLAALDVAEGDPDRALERALSTAQLVSRTDLERPATGLLLSALRAAAQLGAPAEVDRLLELLPGALDGPTGPAVRAQAAAARSTALGRPDPDAWLAAAAAWESAGRPYERACALVQGAEALLVPRGRRSEAAEALGTAWQVAQRLGAGPLLAEVTDLARVARLPLPPDDGDREAPAREDSGRSPLGLTEREEQVLCLVAEGRTNREIGQLLYISPKTASVHVTRILQKLGVSSRVQAAAVAGRHGLRSSTLTGTGAP